MVTKKHKCDMSAAVKQTFAENVSRPACQEEPGINFTWELGTTFKKPRLYLLIQGDIYVIRIALVLFKGLKQAIEAINIWAFTKLENYKVSTSPLDGGFVDALPGALLIWGLVKYSDPQILFEFDYLTSKIQNHHDRYITYKVFTSSIRNNTVFFYISKSELSRWWSLLAAKYQLSS